MKKIAIVLLLILSINAQKYDYDFENFLVTAHGGGVQDPPLQGSQDWGGFPTDSTGRVNQEDGSAWFFHGGGAAGNTYDDFISRVVRGSGWDHLANNVFEYRWTYEDDNYAYHAYGGSPGSLIRVPFEVWNVTKGFRLVVWMYDYDENYKYGLMTNDHIGSSGNNDPSTDWIYPRLPLDTSPGEAGYQAWLAASIAAGGGSPNNDGTYIGGSVNNGRDYWGINYGDEVMGRNIWYAYNLDDLSDGTIDAFIGHDFNGDGVGDNTGMEKGTVVQITISQYKGTNLPPVISSIDDVTNLEDDGHTIKLSATDVDGDAITYSAKSDTNALSVSFPYTNEPNMLRIEPIANWNGESIITAFASDKYAKDSTTFKFTVTPVNDIAEVDDITIDEDKSTEVTLTSTFTGTSTFTATSDTSITVTVASDKLTITPKANWNGVASIKAYVSDGTYKDSTSFDLTVTPVQDPPNAFEWMTSGLDTININESNLAETYDLEWTESKDVDGDSINYLLFAKVGVYEEDEIWDTTSTKVKISYSEILEGVFEGQPNNAATVKFIVKSTDGIDTVNVTGDDRVLYVNRYDYLSTLNEGVPDKFTLHENYPNPFNPTTTLRFDLPEVSNLTLTIYNMLGQKVRTFNYQNTSAGYHSVKWNATNDYGDPVGAGVYLYQLQANQYVKTRKMVLLK